MVWDHTIGAKEIAQEWARLTFDADKPATAEIVDLLMGSRETVVNYSMPLGLHHIMERGHLYGPGPWVEGGRPLWDELALRYQQGVDEVRAMITRWDGLRGLIDRERWQATRARLVVQGKAAREWRDACLLYFQLFSQRALPAGVEPPAHDLPHYIDVNRRYLPGHPGNN